MDGGRVQVAIEKYGATLTVYAIGSGWWKARLEWVHNDEIAGCEAGGSDREAALMSLGAVLHRAGLV